MDLKAKKVLVTGASGFIGSHLANKVKSLMGSMCEIEMDETRIRPGGSEVQRLMGDSTVLSELTGWTPGCSLEEGLNLTIEWFSKKENLRIYKPNIYNI